MYRIFDYPNDKNLYSRCNIFGIGFKLKEKNFNFNGNRISFQIEKQCKLFKQFIAKYCK